METGCTPFGIACSVQPETASGLSEGADNAAAACDVPNTAPASAAPPKTLGDGSLPSDVAKDAAVEDRDEREACGAHAETAGTKPSKQGLDNGQPTKLRPPRTARVANAPLPSMELKQAGPRAADKASVSLDMKIREKAIAVGFKAPVRLVVCVARKRTCDCRRI